jgi:ATP synthase mitochondrial F1 complex assembly factor 1
MMVCVVEEMLTTSREGLKDIASLREAYKNKIEALRKEAAIESPPKTISKPHTNDAPTIPSTPFRPPPPPVPQASSASSTSQSSTPPGVKTLSSFIDIDKTLSLPLKEIEYIWRLRHASNARSLCAVIPGQTYAHIALTARKHPQFVLPVPREGQGAEMHFLQWTFPHLHTASILFTTLAEYKLRGEFASPHTTVNMHTELLEQKGIVLAQGQVMTDKGVSVDDGKWLFTCLQKFYGIQQGKDPGRPRKLLEQFTSGDEEFQVQKLLDETERLG